ncbi:hypothetical protein V3N99_08800 [Dermatophilaceae bacterium Soc4.6]
MALTCWEARIPDDPTVPARLRSLDLREGLTHAGFTDVVVVERKAWRTAEHAMWMEAVALDPGDNDAALRSFHDEGVRALATHDALRRVLATATAPGR